MIKQSSKLKICNYSLIALVFVILFSGIQLEILSGRLSEWVWAHIAVGLLFMLFCGWHVWLHFKKSNWFLKFRKQKSQVTRILWWVAIVTFLSGIIATIHWIVSGGHSPIGAVHGKLGFLMIILAGAHAIKRRKFYFRKKH